MGERSVRAALAPNANSLAGETTRRVGFALLCHGDRSAEKTAKRHRQRGSWLGAPSGPEPDVTSDVQSGHAVERLRGERSAPFGAGTGAARGRWRAPRRDDPAQRHSTAESGRTIALRRRPVAVDD